MKILLTAFDPFGGETINPAEEAVRLVPDRICGTEIVKLTVPTVFGKSVEVTAKAIRKENRMKYGMISIICSFPPYRRNNV